MDHQEVPVILKKLTLDFLQLRRGKMVRLANLTEWDIHAVFAEEDEKMIPRKEYQNIESATGKYAHMLRIYIKHKECGLKTISSMSQEERLLITNRLGIPYTKDDLNYWAINFFIWVGGINANYISNLCKGLPKKLDVYTRIWEKNPASFFYQLTDEKKGVLLKKYKNEMKILSDILSKD